jgi:phosphoketolase
MHATIGIHARQEACARPIVGKVLSAEELRKIDAYWRAGSYLAYAYQSDIDKPEIEQWTWPV